MARTAWLILALIVSLALIPLACVARARVKPSAAPRWHLIQDMDNQGRYKAQQGNPLFADSRAMRPDPPGSVARGQLAADRHLQLGLVDDGYARTLPMPLTRELLERGRERFEIFCAPCHGLAGYGDGPVARRADRLRQGTWVPPASLHAEPAASRPPGHLFNTISNGIRNMPPYRSQIDVQDRWAIVAYLRALQRSQHARLDDVPAELRERLEPAPRRE